MSFRDIRSICFEDTSPYWVSFFYCYYYSRRCSIVLCYATINRNYLLFQCQHRSVCLWQENIKHEIFKDMAVFQWINLSWADVSLALIRPIHIKRLMWPISSLKDTWKLVEKSIQLPQSYLSGCLKGRCPTPHPEGCRSSKEWAESRRIPWWRCSGSSMLRHSFGTLHGSLIFIAPQ